MRSSEAEPVKMGFDVEKLMRVKLNILKSMIMKLVELEAEYRDVIVAWYGFPCKLEFRSYWLQIFISKAETL